MKLTIRLFGPILLHVKDQPMPHVRNRKTLSLLALLVLRHGRSVERDWLAGASWPEADQDQAFGNLRPVLSDLRRALESEGERLQSPSRHALTMDLTGAVVDVQAFDVLIARKSLPALAEAVDLYAGPLSEGCAEEWVFQERRMCEEKCPDLGNNEGLVASLSA